jgi:hypothetical protein
MDILRLHVAMEKVSKEKGWSCKNLLKMGASWVFTQWPAFEQPLHCPKDL